MRPKTKVNFPLYHGCAIEMMSHTALLLLKLQCQSVHAGVTKTLYGLVQRIRRIKELYELRRECGIKRAPFE